MSKPLRRLQEEGGWFARAREVRLLWVRADASSRGMALSFTEQLEYHADNASPFILLDAPWSGSDNGALARVSRFVERFAVKREALAQAGVTVGGYSPAAAPAARLDALAAELARACDSLQPPLSGLVIVLAPPRVDDAAGFIADVGALLAAPSLTAVRWVIIEADSEHLGALVEQLGSARALAVDARIDPSEQRRDLAALAGPPPAPGEPLVAPAPWGAWSSGGAMPSVVPPRRLDAPPAPTDAQLEAAGLSPLFLKGGAQRVKSLILGASVAASEGRLAEAVELQARAARLFAELDMPAEQVTALLGLGAYSLAASQGESARQSYDRAGDVARGARLPGAQAQAELALGLLDALEGRTSALGHYTAAAELAEAAGAVPLAIECWRMAGQLALERDLPADAAAHWQRALDRAEALELAAARHTSGAEVARLLARAAEQRGEAAAAADLQRRAFRLEHGAEPGPLLAQPPQPSARA